MTATRVGSALWSLTLGVLAFGLDRAQKAYHVSSDCIALGEARCVEVGFAYAPFEWTGWRGGEVVRVTDFFDYVLVWNTGISYGLLADFPVLVIGAIMAAAIVALSIWWARTDELVTRCGLALIVGGALSNALDRALYGAVADFFHFHWSGWSFYIFNIADAAITVGVLLLILDLIPFTKRPTA